MPFFIIFLFLHTSIYDDEKTELAKRRRIMANAWNFRPENYRGIEALITECGDVIPAAPCHDKAAARLAISVTGLSLHELSEEYNASGGYYDWISFLLEKSGAVAIWKDCYKGSLNKKQRRCLMILRARGLCSQMTKIGW